MHFRLPLVGSGAPGDEYRADLPTYTTVAVDYDNRLIVVDVPASELPVGFAAIGRDAPITTDGYQLDPLGKPILTAPLIKVVKTFPNVVQDVAPEHAAAWHEHLDERYVEHAGRYRPAPR